MRDAVIRYGLLLCTVGRSDGVRFHPECETQSSPLNCCVATNLHEPIRQEPLLSVDADERLV